MADLNALAEKLAQAEVERERTSDAAEVAYRLADDAAVAVVEAKKALDDAIGRTTAEHRVNLRGRRAGPPSGEPT